MFKLFAVFMIMSIAFVSCEKDTDEFFSQNDEIVLKSDAVNPLVEPILWTEDDGPGGNATCADVGLGDVVMSTGRIDFEDGEFQFDDGDGWIDGLTVTVTDGKFVEWNYQTEPFEEDGEWFVHVVGAVIVKGGPAANIYVYNDENSYGWDDEMGYNLWVSTDNNLQSPDNDGGNIAELSNLTFCIVEREYIPLPPDFNPFPQECFEWQTETAWAANGDVPGSIRYVNRGNWATYLIFENEEKTVSLFAGQTTFVGTATLTPVDGGMVEIEILLEDGWELAIYDYDEFGNIIEDTFDGQTVKIQGYDDEPPARNPAPGQFAHKGNEFTVTIPTANFFGIHLDVGLLTQVECPEEE